MTDIDRAIRAASKKLPFTSAKKQNEMLEYAADDKAEAYRIGAEEAQREIVLRLHALDPGKQRPAPKTPVSVYQIGSTVHVGKLGSR